MSVVNSSDGNLNLFDSCQIVVLDNPGCRFKGSYLDQVIQVDCLVAVGLYLQFPSIRDKIITGHR